MDTPPPPASDADVTLAMIRYTIKLLTPRIGGGRVSPADVALARNRLTVVLARLTNTQPLPETDHVE